jgi:hypothetical protein
MPLPAWLIVRYRKLRRWYKKGPSADARQMKMYYKRYDPASAFIPL